MRRPAPQGRGRAFGQQLRAFEAGDAEVGGPEAPRRITRKSVRPAGAGRGGSVAQTNLWAGKPRRSR
jgi:hypothetical protein